MENMQLHFHVQKDSLDEPWTVLSQSRRDFSISDAALSGEVGKVTCHNGGDRAGLEGMLQDAIRFSVQLERGGAKAPMQ